MVLACDCSRADSSYQSLSSGVFCHPLTCHRPSSGSPDIINLPTSLVPLMLTGRSGTGFGEIRGDSSGLYAPGITADLEFDAGSEEVVATPITESHNSLESFVNGGVRVSSISLLDWDCLQNWDGRASEAATADGRYPFRLCFSAPLPSSISTNAWITRFRPRRRTRRMNQDAAQMTMRPMMIRHATRVVGLYALRRCPYLG